MTDIFIKKAIIIHGDKYDYSESKYINCDTKLIIKCNDCLTIFEQIPYNHINKKSGCIKCSNLKKSNETLQLRLNDFIEKAIEKHGEKYDYSKVIYKDSKTPVIIVCNICNNEFKQIRNTHLLGDGGCKICAKKKFKQNRSFTNEIFIKKAKEIHGDKYDYLEVNYIDSQTHVTIKCITCNYTFETIPNNHLRGKGCKNCANKLLGDNLRKSQEQFIKECNEKHKDENGLPIYDYSLVEYNSTHEKVKIICQIHGEFEQCPSDHLSGKGCNECGILKRTINQTFTKEEFLERAFEKHGNNYDYSHVNYVNSQTKIFIKCNICEYIFVLCGVVPATTTE
jgi:UDP-2,3-diacylglucosamine pyrophosphatase LpxH